MGREWGCSLVHDNWSFTLVSKDFGIKKCLLSGPAIMNDKFRRGIYIFCSPFPGSKRWEWKLRSNGPDYGVTECQLRRPILSLILF